MVIRNKRGWLRIFEATIAIMLILSSLLLIYRSQQTAPRESDYVLNWQNEMLSGIANDNELRNATLFNNTEPLKVFIDDNLLPNLNYSIKICDGLIGSCPMEDVEYNQIKDKDIFVQERIISGTLEKIDPKRIRFFVWKV
jgi:hypothetical protein